MSRNEIRALEGLVDEGTASREALDAAIATAKRNRCSVAHALASGGVPRDAIGRALSKFFRVELVAFREGQKLPEELAEKIAPHFLARAGVVPVGWRGERLVLLMSDPKDVHVRDDVAMRLGARAIVAKVAVREDVLKALGTSGSSSATARPRTRRGGRPSD